MITTTSNEAPNTNKKKLQLITYSSIIDDLSYIQCHTKKCEKRTTLSHIATFLIREGYEQLGNALEARTRELTHE